MLLNVYPLGLFHFLGLSLGICCVRELAHLERGAADTRLPRLVRARDRLEEVVVGLVRLVVLTDVLVGLLRDHDQLGPDLVRATTLLHLISLAFADESFSAHSFRIML